MTKLILQGGGMAAPLETEAETGSLLIDTVRDLVRDGCLPLYWRCGRGTCGACLVHLTAYPVQKDAVVVMSGKERNVLARQGLLTAEQCAATCLADTPALPRLACHVVLPPGLLKVDW
ncbi:ferredoxin [Chitinimonas sp. JJ19]|uniref:ferredoxin n=1 Tax=Chitinimonas sp. JJ19 TaxID=3109352 RepID=UPI00300143B0